MSRAVLLSCEGVSRSFGVRPLFENLTFALFDGDHVGLIGPNGSGKSTLLRILSGSELPDSGARVVRRGIRVGYVPQDPVFTPGRTVEEVLLEALAGDARLEDYEREARVGVTLGKTGFDDLKQKTDTLSGGWRKRLAIAHELVQEPDILLLDEPTNHLDVEGILWLEGLLKSEPEAFIVVSHDRYFLENITKKMIELSRVYPEGLLQANGSYSEFLEKRDELLRGQAAYQETLANLVRREMEWLRRGAKARTTKSKARIQSAESLIDELGESRVRSRTEIAKIDFTSSERQTKRLWSCKGLGKSFEGREIFRGLDLLLTPGTRLGVLGPNGSGKTTLLRTIVGELEPDEGTVERADRLRIVYFEQNRESLDPELPLRRALAPEGDSVVFRDRSLHVASWAKRFLFRTEQLDTKVGSLSGGEKARVVLARLMLDPADLLVLDEPTNDLDIATLDVLEESLLEFPGALLLVTHDRYMLDRVSTSILALDGRGGCGMFADYTQWESSRREFQSGEARQGDRPQAGRPRVKKLTYAEQKELAQMEATVLEAEARVASAKARAEAPSIASDAAELHRRWAALAAAQVEVDRLYARWSELEEKRAAGEN
ncbi:MAG: ABC-F family ATP-binding cassette domain-containing protein [Thermoanaerobaculia bacterium]|nr:ABC-F family ATP-binding cassette domain-containing protein [Thermoanaerobaculia bacterium]